MRRSELKHTAPRRGTVRIIAGRWRGRKLPVPEGVRPSADRVRETLFNWLAPRIVGSRCLDLFAGSGALGFEAASRGASSVWLVDKESSVADALRAQARSLGAREIRVACREAAGFLASEPLEFDIIFLDPPFDTGGVRALLAAARRRLAADGLLYLEQRAGAWPEVPPGYTIRRKARAGDVQYGLLLCDNETTPED
jgi:16S rRNA (guanine966-N2)-methyltransferase